MTREIAVEATPLDYDVEPDRFRTGSECSRKYGPGDVHEAVAKRIAGEQLSPVLDLGCGEGRLCRLLEDRGIPVVGVDNSPTMLSAVSSSRVLGDASDLPFRDAWFGAVAALYMLYHVPNPLTALNESCRVLRAGGLFVAVTPSRDNDPELADILPQGPSPFDAEDAPDMVRSVFTRVEVESWAAPLVHLPTEDALSEYLFGRGIPRAECGKAAKRVGAPIDITKRGCLIWGYKDA
ncbi:class I SAM-dependent methyltransferase [Candidatus Sumerlaeota bacterium]